MATASTGRKYEWLVVVPDLPDVHEKRLKVRPDHFTNMKPFVDSGAWKMGVPADDDAAKFNFAGSTLVCTGGSKEEIIDMLKKDIYATSGVWDVDKAQIWPFKCAFRHS